MNVDEQQSSGQETEHLDLTVDIVTSYVSNNTLPASEVPNLIAVVHETLTALVVGGKEAVEDKEPQRPAVSIKKSLHDDHLVCLECGLSFKSLKRHLKSHHDMMPEEYRAKWKLPSDYPMVAPAYAKKRSALAKQSGLGQKK